MHDVIPLDDSLKVHALLLAAFEFAHTGDRGPEEDGFDNASHKGFTVRQMAALSVMEQVMCLVGEGGRSHVGIAGTPLHPDEDDENAESVVQEQNLPQELRDSRKRYVYGFDSYRVSTNALVPLREYWQDVVLGGSYRDRPKVSRRETGMSVSSTQSQRQQSRIDKSTPTATTTAADDIEQAHNESAITLRLARLCRGQKILKTLGKLGGVASAPQPRDIANIELFLFPYYAILRNCRAEVGGVLPTCPAVKRLLRTRYEGAVFLQHLEPRQDTTRGSTVGATSPAEDWGLGSDDDDHAEDDDETRNAEKARRNLDPEYLTLLGRKVLGPIISNVSQGPQVYDADHAAAVRDGASYEPQNAGEKGFQRSDMSLIRFLKSDSIKHHRLLQSRLDVMNAHRCLFQSTTADDDEEDQQAHPKQAAHWEIIQRMTDFMLTRMTRANIEGLLWNVDGWHCRGMQAAAYQGHDKLLVKIHYHSRVSESFQTMNDWVRGNIEHPSYAGISGEIVALSEP